MRSQLIAGTLLLASCGSPAPKAGAELEPLVVFAASSLARPLGDALRVFVDSGAPTPRMIVAGSLDLARRITDLSETPDLLVLADEEVMRALLMPRTVTGYARFARNRLVIVYSIRNRNTITDSNWTEVLTRPNVQVARADPSRAPVGYRTLLAWQLAERRLGNPGLSARLSRAAGIQSLRASEAEVLALVESGEADYGWAYESSALAAGLWVHRLPPWMDFGEPSESTSYAGAKLLIQFGTLSDSITVRGAPIAYVIAVPTAAPNAARARKLADFLLSTAGKRVLAAAGLDTLTAPVVVGTGWSP